MIKLKNKQLGLSLIELMTAMVIGLILLSGAATMFMTNKRVYQEQNEMGQLQENARFAMDLLIKDIRSVAFVGCVDNIDTVTNHIDGASNTTLTGFSESGTSNLIEGSENGGNWQPSNSNSSVASMITNTDGIASDGITIRYLRTTGVSVNATMASVAADVSVGAGNGFAQGTYLAVSDCGGTDIFRVTNTDSNTTGNLKHANVANFNTSSNLSRVYDGDAVIYQLHNRRYFIANSGNATGPALWRETPSGTEELVEGVESMQILYGVDTTSDFVADSYVNAAAVANWSDVVSVKVSLLFRTVHQYGSDTDSNTYNLLGTVVDPVDDRRRRRIFTSTVEIRNRKS